MSITVRDKDGNVINPEDVTVPESNPIYLIIGEKNEQTERVICEPLHGSRKAS